MYIDEDLQCKFLVIRVSAVLLCGACNALHAVPCNARTGGWWSRRGRPSSQRAQEPASVGEALINAGMLRRTVVTKDLNVIRVCVFV